MRVGLVELELEQYPALAFLLIIYQNVEKKCTFICLSYFVASEKLRCLMIAF